MTLCTILFSAVLAAAPVQTAHCRSPYVGAIAIDAANGRVLLTDHADAECYPASCTKLMTLRLTFKAIAAGKLRLRDKVVQSARSAREKPSAMGLDPGEEMSVDDALKALMVKSANDVAVMLAERIAGDVESFVTNMNVEAQALGMNRTVFVTPNGYPPPKGSKRGFDRSTAEDLAKLAMAIVNEQPTALEYTSLASTTVKGRHGEMVPLQNHNFFLWKRGIFMSEVDGLKTGYHDAGGSSIVLTAKRNGKRVIAVVVGSASREEREKCATQIITDALGAVAW